MLILFFNTILFLDWNASRLKFFVDEKEIFTYTKEPGAGFDSWPFDKEMNIITNTAVGGHWVNIK